MTKNFDLVTFYSSDNIELKGAFFNSEVKSEWAIIHVHGLAGNFYENSFIDKMAQSYTKSGINFLSFNNRGHDYVADNYNKHGETIKGGAAYDLFSNCVLDIDAAILFVKEKGIKNIILQGHSSGANKVIYYNFIKSPVDIKGYILLSPCDDIAIQIENKDKIEFNKLLVDAENLVKENEGELLMPEGTFYSYLMSAATYFDYFKTDSPHDIFHYREQEREFKELNAIYNPIFIRFGTKGEYLLSPEDAIKCLDKEITSSKDIGFIVGASHNYRGFEKVLIDQIINWKSGLN